MECPFIKGDSVNAGESFVWCLVKCNDCDQAYSREITWATFAIEVFKKAGWQRGVGGVWLCPECVETSHLSYKFTYEERQALLKEEDEDSDVSAPPAGE